MNHRAKFDAASFILGGEILNRTNTQTVSVTDIAHPHLAYRHVWIINLQRLTDNDLVIDPGVDLVPYP